MLITIILLNYEVIQKTLFLKTAYSRCEICADDIVVN